MDKLILVDTIETVSGGTDKLYCLKVSDLASTLHSGSPHDINLATALELGKRLGMDLPERL